MIIETFRSGSRWVRAKAYALIMARDGVSGWQRGQAQFKNDLGTDAAVLSRFCKKRLEQILSHASRTVPYYQSVWSGLGFGASRSPGADELTKLPLITKEIIRSEKERMISTEYQKEDLLVSYTGGTTGVQTAFYMDSNCRVQRIGRQWGALNLCGYWPGMRRALVWGVHSDLSAAGATTLKQRFRRFASADLPFCCTVLKDEDMRHLQQQLLEFRPQVLYGYPSALIHFGEFLQRNHLLGIDVPTIITTAERLTRNSRDTLQRVFSGEVFNLYCTREYGCVAHECSEHHGLHIDTGSVHIEIVENGVPVPDGLPGEIVITDMLNFGMPLIRSRTGDRGRLALAPCACGSPFPRLESLDGRSTDNIALPNGSSVAGLMLSDLFTDLPGLRHVQFVQRQINCLEVHVVASNEFSQDVEVIALRELRDIVGDDIDVSIVRVAELPRNPRSGKIAEVVSLIRAAADT